MATAFQVRELQRALQSFSDRYKLGQHIPVTSVYDGATDRQSKWMQWLLGFGQDQIGKWPLDQVISWLNHPSLYYAGHPGGYARHVARLKQVRSGGSNAQHISAAGTRFIAEFEGSAANWYSDAVGVQTIGYGHTGPLPHGYVAPLSHQRQLDLLAHDLITYEDGVKSRVKVDMAQNVLDGLVSFAYNLGPGALDDGIAAAVNGGNLKGACNILLQYDHAGGQRLPGLTRRRQAEAKMILNGKY